MRRRGVLLFGDQTVTHASGEIPEFDPKKARKFFERNFGERTARPNVPSWNEMQRSSETGVGSQTGGEADPDQVGLIGVPLHVEYDELVAYRAREILGPLFRQIAREEEVPVEEMTAAARELGILFEHDEELLSYSMLTAGEQRKMNRHLRRILKSRFAIYEDALDRVEDVPTPSGVYRIVRTGGLSLVDDFTGLTADSFTAEFHLVRGYPHLVWLLYKYNKEAFNFLSFPATIETIEENARFIRKVMRYALRYERVNEVLGYRLGASLEEVVGPLE
ncbi:hypothetical protein [Natrinema salaciae]|uniref:Uncharacterized protein n=1 Tax=Natrinema salaciae TaxID=1186196 RepID=A0A1H9CMG2_9EURY|nr:hypothetical protein [Natrinema salaciae]SEQ02359.1 hypothetical protein SAMN04489841_1097 [Natrinema salaciae]